MKAPAPSAIVFKKISIMALAFLLMSGFSAKAVDPIVTVRFANPEYVCSTHIYSLDVEFQCNTASKQLFGMNVRFFYPDNILEFISFGEFVTGYGAVSPNPPIITTGNSSSGMSLFGFPGAQEYINGAIQKTSTTSLTLSTTGWTKIFNVSFHIDDPNAFNIDSFCPPAIWDLNEAASGGINPSGGIIITVVNGSGSANATEHCVQFNWQYDGIPGLPHGFPVSTTCLNTICSYAPHTILPFFGANTPGQINIPVKVVDFDNIGAFNLVFEYDPAVMTYINNTPNAIFTAENGLLNVADSVSTGGKHKIKMNFQGNNPISISDSSDLAVISFNYISESTDLTWKADGTSCQYADSNYIQVYDLPFQNYYLNGMTLFAIAPETKIDSALAVDGDFVTFPVRVWDFIDIYSGMLTLNYNPDVLVFQEAAPNAAITNDFVAEAESPGILEIGWLGNDTSLADGSTLAFLTFQYLGGSTPLTWFDNGVSCHYTNSYLPLPLSDEPATDYYINGNIASSVYVWTGNNSCDWNSCTNWGNGIVPDEFINVTIDPSVDPVNWPVYNGDFTLGENCRNLTLSGNAQFTVNGNLIIDPGNVLNIGSGVLKVSGDWLNSGIFETGTGSVEFIGTEDAFIANGVPPENYIANYILSTFASGMVPITGGAAGPAGNDAHSDVNIGFDFKYLGINYSQVRINTNGWLSLNLTGDDPASSDNTLLFNTSSPFTVLAPWWDDLKADATTTIAYLTQGTTPSRVFTAEWKDILAFSSGSTTRLNFQVKLYENSNIVEFCYGSLTSGTHHADEGASIGIKDATGGTGNFIEASQNSTNLVLTYLQSNSDWPGVNYRFTPPLESNMEVFNKIIVSKSGGGLHIQRDVKITGID
jgi:hypothetical protein